MKKLLFACLATGVFAFASCEAPKSETAATEETTAMEETEVVETEVEEAATATEAAVMQGAEVIDSTATATTDSVKAKM